MSGHARQHKRRPTRRRVAGAVFAVLVLMVLAAAWVAVRGLQARDAATEARAAAGRTRAAVLAGDTALAGRELAATQRAARHAESLVSDPLWRVSTRLPFLGADARAVRAVTGAVDDLARDVLPPLVEVGADLGPGALRLEGNALDLAALTRAQPLLARADDRAAQIATSLAAVDKAGLAGPVSRGVRDARHALDDAASTVRTARTTAELLPPMLGRDGPRRYFLAFQNNAEARGTGGLLGAYGILEADKGKLTLAHLGPNTELKNATRVPVDLGPDYAQMWGDDPALWVNSNVSPHFPYAAQIWLALWQRQSGQRLDGVIATDPSGLAAVLKATGPIKLPAGGEVSAGNAVALTLRDVYARFPKPGQNPQRDLYLQQIAAAVFGRVLGGGVDARALATAMQAAAGQRRLLVYSTRAEEEARLAPTEVSGVLSDAPGPYAALAINNGAGGKLDYYLERRLSYVSATCANGKRTSRITVTLRNSAPAAGLPDYVTLRVDRGALSVTDPGEPPGTNVSIVQVYAADGADLTGARLDGQTLLVSPRQERGHAVFQFRTTLAPGQTRVAVLDLVEPIVVKAPGKFVQPLVKGLDSRTDVQVCPQNSRAP